MSVEDQVPIVGRLLLAAFLGGLVGAEREYRGYPAGVRTTALVTLGAALFTEVGMLMSNDSSRVAAQVVSGIGFIGAGVIFRQGTDIHGVTTAATIWAAASLGLAVANSLFLVAGAFTVFILVLLELRPITQRIEGTSDNTAADWPSQQ